MIGESISHYKIVAKIGEGGMGVVYKAEDTKLRRTVALKFLPRELMRDKEAKARFIREAQTAAALHHPHIATIFEIDEEGEWVYISMAFIEGQSLMEKIAQGPLNREEAVDIAIQVAEGLKAAHARGVVHRDIKPANIMLTPEGQAKIMDFGLAKFARGADVTQTMAIMGTAAYMSPEQAWGEAVDHQTDIWSFGGTFYEMLTGKLPFGKRHGEALIYAILNEEPEPLSAACPDIPRAIEQIVLKALEKEPAGRYQSMDELLNDLKAALSPVKMVSEQKKSIIVLPFENISPDPEQEYFCDGMTEEIISDLSQIHDLLVISRSSAMTFKGTTKKIKEIGKELNVQYVLEGSVRKVGNNLRITSQLIDARNDVHLWAKKYSGTLDDVFDIQEKVSRSIVDALKIKLSPKENQNIAERPIENVLAYEYYLKALNEIYRVTENSLKNAVKLIENGLRIVGGNEILYASLGKAYLWHYNLGFSRTESTLAKAEKYLDKVYSLNPQSSYGHSLGGSIYWQKGQIQDAVRSFKKALEIKRSDPETLMTLAWMYSISGKGFAAKPLMQEVLEIDPLTPINYHGIGTYEFFDGNFEIGVKENFKAVQIDPKNPLFRLCQGIFLVYNHSLKEEFEILEATANESPDFIYTKVGLLLKYALEKKKSKAMDILTDEFENEMKSDESFTIWIAASLSLLKEIDMAIKWLEYGIKAGFINYPYLNEYDPFLEDIRGEERFKKLMERVKHEWENFEV